MIERLYQFLEMSNHSNRKKTGCQPPSKKKEREKEEKEKVSWFGFSPNSATPYSQLRYSLLPTPFSLSSYKGGAFYPFFW